MDIFAIPKLKFSIKKVQSNGFSGIRDKITLQLIRTSEKLSNLLEVQRFSEVRDQFELAILSVTPENPLLWTF